MVVIAVTTRSRAKRLFSAANCTIACLFLFTEPGDPSILWSLVGRQVQLRNDLLHAGYLITQIAGIRKLSILLVGARLFEPPTSRSQIAAAAKT